MCIDKKGNLWIATGNGLNMFNGKFVDKYYASEYPQLHSSNVIQVTCDSDNRIWVMTFGGYVTMLDEKRQLHRVAIYESGTHIKTRWILNSQNGGIILLTERGHYAIKPDVKLNREDSLTNYSFSFLTIKGFDTLISQRHRQVFYYDDDNYLLINTDGFYKINYTTRQVEKKYDVPDCNALLKWGQNELLFYDRTAKEVKVIDLISQKISFPFRDIKDQYGKTVSAVFNFAEKINASRYIFTTINAGIYIYDAAAQKIYNYTHHIADPHSIIGNTQTVLAVEPNGWVFVACNPNGISYFNLNDFTGNQNVFTDNRGNGYDGYIAGIATTDNNTYYIGTATGMLEWKRNTNTTIFIDFKDTDGNSVFRQLQVTSIVIDKYEKIWAITRDNGIIVFNKGRKLLRHLKVEEGKKEGLRIKLLGRMFMGNDGFIWVNGRTGLCRIDPRTYRVDNFENTPLQNFDTIPIPVVKFIDDNNILVSTTSSGIYQYNLQTKGLAEISAFSPFKLYGVNDVGTDNAGSIYVVNRRGLQIIFPNGRVKEITARDGLVVDVGESVIRDKHNRMWVGNDIGLVCYNPGDSSLRTFDERYGLSIYGFRVGSYFLMPNGEFFFGTPNGLQYFHPDSLFNKKINLNVSVTRVETKRIVSNVTENSSFKLAANDNQVTFSFGTVDYSPHLRTYYEYKLVDLDKDWIKIADQNSVRYNSLPPGNYVFKVRVSNDNKTWQEADNEVSISIAVPFYQSPWFKGGGVLIALALIFLVIDFFRKKQLKKSAELETELLITQFASQINRHKNVNELLWDVTKNCISRMQFEDCVIYLKNPQRNVLIQVAAHGPKNPVDLTIHQPIEIPVGKGIVGTVALTGKPELIGDTETDSRYIIDDNKRLSELAVPIVIDGEVHGVIDSENPKKNFFTNRHMQVLTAVAALSASQIQRIRAEEDKQKATIELLENKRKAMESRLQSLRLQMNPHFLFNALNSVQQMILANEEMVATKYLSKFSKLLRAILIQSDKETITLKEEMEILKLYVDLESIRFKDSFHYEITCDEQIDADEVKIPTLLVQPFVENAIWHGLMHKEDGRLLKINFSEENDFIRCSIEDNGVGRQKAAELKLMDGQRRNHTSKGISVSVERLKAMKTNGKEGSINIIDLLDPNNKPRGTKVEIDFPVQN